MGRGRGRRASHQVIGSRIHVALGWRVEGRVDGRVGRRAGGRTVGEALGVGEEGRGKHGHVEGRDEGEVRRTDDIVKEMEGRGGGKASERSKHKVRKQGRNEGGRDQRRQGGRKEGTDEALQYLRAGQGSLGEGPGVRRGTTQPSNPAHPPRSSSLPPRLPRRRRRLELPPPFLRPLGGRDRRKGEILPPPPRFSLLPPPPLRLLYPHPRAASSLLPVGGVKSW